jgi:hypothetical protein
LFAASLDDANIKENLATLSSDDDQTIRITARQLTSRLTQALT